MRLRNRYVVAGETDRGGIDRQSTSRCYLVEALEKGNLTRRMVRNHAPFGQEPPRVEARAPCTMRHPGGMINVVIHISPAKETLYLPTLVSSNAPKARSDAFCASVRPRMPVIVSRS